jgi:hypothetical protein
LAADTTGAMTRILYWNVQNFSLPKVLKFTSQTEFVQSQSRLRHIVQEVISPQAPLPANSPPPPDMIVIVECYSRTMEVSYQGNVLNQGGNVGRGVLWVLNEIRHFLGNTWCVVPPLMTGDFGFREAVAVYYNAASLTFTGPYVWATAGGLTLSRPATPANVGNLQDYSQQWKQGLPNPNNFIGPLQLNRTWAVGGANVNEWQGAGQWEHYDANGHRIDFPYPNNRSPFYVRMLDTTGRTIKLFAVHTTPTSAAAATNRIADIPDVVVGVNEVGVVVGDFNVDSFDNNNNGAYAALLNQGYDFLLDPRDNTMNVNPARKPYCMTHLLPPALAAPYNATGVAPDPQHNVYPRFGYMGSRMIGNPGQALDWGAIDNALVSYPVGTVPPAANTTIVNTVVGKPYTAGPVPVGVGPALTGGYGYTASLTNPVPVPAGVNPTAGRGLFPEWNNYQRITSVSDHLAIVFDV